MDSATFLSDLERLFLSPYEAKAYLALIKNGSITASELSKVAAIPKQRTHDILRNLETKGFAISHPGRARLYKPVSPQLAFNQALEKEEGRFETEMEHRRDVASQLASELDSVFDPKSTDKSPSEYIWTVRGGPNISATYVESLGKAEETVVELLKEPYSELEPQIQEYAKTLERGVSVKFILHEEEKGFGEEIIQFMSRLGRRGAEVKTHPVIHAKLAVIDTSEAWTALMDPASVEETFTALIIQHAQTAKMYHHYFEKMWAEADDFSK